MFHWSLYLDLTLIENSPYKFWSPAFLFLLRPSTWIVAGGDCWRVPLWVKDPQNSDTNYESLHTTRSHMKVCYALVPSNLYNANPRKKKKARYTPPTPQALCFLHYRWTYREYYNNTSSDEFKLYFLSKRIEWIIAWGFYREQKPRHPHRSAIPTLHKRGCLLTLHTLPLHSFSQGFISSWHKKKGGGGEFLCWIYLRFVFKFSWNLWEHWGAISYLHWHLISQVKSENTNCQGFPVCPIILHQFPWPYGTLVN